MHVSILFVEDNKDLRDNAAMILSLEGYEVEVAQDGREALDILDKGFVPALIVSDIMMPRMDGYEFFQAVRQRDHLKAVPFIFLTALGSRRDVSVGKMMGADDYLIKPFEPEEFLIAIQNKLQRTAEIRADLVQQLDGARRSLVQLLSHELRTPLTYVTGGFALLAEELDRLQQNAMTEDVRISLDLIQSGTHRLNRLAEQMVLYSQIASGFVSHRIAESSESLDMAFLITDAQHTVLDLSQERDVVIHKVNSDAFQFRVMGIQDLLVTAFSEILRNAVLYSPIGSEIEVALGRDQTWGILTVSDHGAGIKPDDQTGIWDVMIQSDRERNEQQGAGMGLPITKGIIEAHKGTVTLHSVPDEGTRVTIRLPLVGESASAG